MNSYDAYEPLDSVRDNYQTAEIVIIFLAVWSIMFAGAFGWLMGAF